MNQQQGVRAIPSDQGFHQRDGWYFKRESDGSVWITHWLRIHGPDGPWIIDRQHLIPAAEWASVVASVSSQGETGDTYQRAVELHG